MAVPRSDRASGLEILAGHFCGELPRTLGVLVDQGLVDRIIAHVYDTPTPFAANREGTAGILRRDMVSGGLFAQIAKELKLSGCLSEICGKEPPSWRTDRLADRLMAAQIAAQATNSGGAFPCVRCRQEAILAENLSITEY